MKNYILTGAAAIVLVLSSCNKNETIEGPNPTIEPAQVSEIAQLQKDYIVDKTQHFFADANTAATLTGNLGTQIILSGINFTDQNGNQLSGNVDVSLVEIYSPVDMILMNKTTVGVNNGAQGILTSGGEFSIEVTQNGNPVKIANDIQVITAPSNSFNSSMSLFGANEDAQGGVLWDPLSAPLVLDTSTFSYVFDVDTDYQWVNCDYFWSFTGNQTEVILDLPAGFDNSNTMVYAAFPSENAASQLSYIVGSQFGTVSSYSLPLGLNVTYVVLSSQNGQISYAVETSTVAPNFSLMNFNQATTLDEVKVAIAPYL